MFGMSPANAVAIFAALTAAWGLKLSCARLGRNGALAHVDGDVLHLLSARKEHHSLCFVVSQFEAD